MRYYIYSTLAAPQAYTTYLKNSEKELPIVESTVLIKGGTGVMDAKNIQTPRGVMTEVSEAEYKALQQNYVFNMHVENGYITVEEKEVKVDKIAKDMSHDDKSRPITPNDFEKPKDGKPGKFKRDL